MTRTAEICAHRGESWGHLENTLAAFQAAIDGGATCVELDVRVTADGVPVVVHDQTLARIWGVPRRVDELGWEQVAALRSAGERIPSLAEALDLFVDGRSDVLIDVTTAAIADLAFTVVREHPARAHTRWCGATEAMRAVRALDPDATVYLAAEGSATPSWSSRWPSCARPTSTAPATSWCPPTWRAATRSASSCRCGPSTTPARCSCSSRSAPTRSPPTGWACCVGSTSWPPRTTPPIP
ncbi:glycerophosphodiester phosphodiesterase [Arsenicicoccus piscis]|uniref:glycerophosphodiester phosphodiesterase n=1 Tax=Arsenicicoccus piscis TaxID=673954 RepID=UPI0024E0A452|nr:glycerophosphodiester phosphodiesterase family protein [Arsenicicoccus piscis]